MTNNLLADLLDTYFEKQTWTLFEAICLLQDIDPKNRKKPIVAHGDEDEMQRPYKIALASMADRRAGHLRDAEGRDHLRELERIEGSEGAARHLVDPRNFVAWACARWPDATSHLKEAEERYQDRKKQAKGWTKAEKALPKSREIAEEAFFELLKEKGIEAKAKFNISEMARELEQRLTKGGEKLYRFDALRKFIRQWIDDSVG
ncbi:hypothetical protein H0I76_07690 [Limibaculum sp. M0105]|uniref:Uncharacterized protein n=1 Tax=Thermohalobaculum xanthum TaxID=2753746 RepID=A0A8J7M745_9RHOB|nr:hypothetical protein [Thermohalobaculum xanthum]MBK0399067.1 hypothetical protein [Thermohalobaculum xanthum]